MTVQDRSQARLDEGAAVGPQVYRLLRGRIVANDLEPGARISETEIAAGYGVSRQPVREAFIKLAEEGLLEVRPQRGTFVRKIAVSAVMDARFVREAIETDIVEDLAGTADEGTIESLRAQIGEQQDALEDPDRFLELDNRFHANLAGSAGKARAWGIVEGLNSQMDRVRRLSMLRSPIPRLVAQHAAVVEAIARRDPAAAAATMRAHLREVLNDLPAIAESRPELFEVAGK